MKRLWAAICAVAALSLLAPPPAEAAGLTILNAVVATGASSTYNLAANKWAKAKIYSAAGSVSTVKLQHRTTAVGDVWTTAFTCTDVDAEGVSSDGTVCYVNLALTSNFRANVTAWTSGTITVILESQ